MKERGDIKSQREISWEQKRTEIDEIGDKLGLSIDENIKELSRLKYGRDRDEVEMEFRRRQEASNFS